MTDGLNTETVTETLDANWSTILARSLTGEHNLLNLCLQTEISGRASMLRLLLRSGNQRPQLLRQLALALRNIHEPSHNQSLNQAAAAVLCSEIRRELRLRELQQYGARELHRMLTESQNLAKHSHDLIKLREYRQSSKVMIDPQLTHCELIHQAGISQANGTGDALQEIIYPLSRLSLLAWNDQQASTSALGWSHRVRSCVLGPTAIGSQRQSPKMLMQDAQRVCRKH